MNDRKHTENNIENDERPDLIIGRNPVLEAVRSGRKIDKLLVANGAQNGSVNVIIAKCREKNIPIKEVSPEKLDYLSGGANHQGVGLFVAAHEYCSIDDIFEYAKEKNENPFIIICDEIEDPHNLGAVIRTAEAAGVHGIIIPKRRSVSLNFTVAKSACGALEYMRVARVTNLSATIDELKSRGVWIYGTDMDGTYWCSEDYTAPTAFVIGNEGKGIGRLIKDKCDVTVSLPMKGKINSLNASVAAGIFMYEAARQRGKISAK